MVQIRIIITRINNKKNYFSWINKPNLILKSIKMCKLAQDFNNNKCCITSTWHSHSSNNSNSNLTTMIISNLFHNNIPVLNLKWINWGLKKVIRKITKTQIVRDKIILCLTILKISIYNFNTLRISTSNNIITPCTRCHSVRIWPFSTSCRVSIQFCNKWTSNKHIYLNICLNKYNNLQYFNKKILNNSSSNLKLISINLNKFNNIIIKVIPHSRSTTLNTTITFLSRATNTIWTILTIKQAIMVLTWNIIILMIFIHISTTLTSFIRPPTILNSSKMSLQDKLKIKWTNLQITSKIN